MDTANVPGTGTEEHVPGPDLTLDEAATRLGVHYMTVYRYVRLGRLSGRQQGGRWLVPTAEVQELATASNRRPPRSRGPGRGARVERLTGRLLAGDGPGSWAVVEQGLVAGSPGDVYVSLLAPALRRIGEGWERGELSVADEHRASAVAMRTLGRLSGSFTRRGRRRPGTVLMAGAGGDPHLMPGAMVADVLRGDGWSVLDLGPNVPQMSLLEAAAAASDLVAVALSISVDQCLPWAGEAVEAIRQTRPDVAVLAGGPAVIDAAVAGSLGVDGWAPDARQAAALVAQLRG
jgi:excisionase family DNA binding protein